MIGGRYRGGVGDELELLLRRQVGWVRDVQVPGVIVHALVEPAQKQINIPDPIAATPLRPARGGGGQSPVGERRLVILDNDARDWASAQEALEGGGREGLRERRLRQRDVQTRGAGPEAFQELLHLHDYTTH